MPQAVGVQGVQALPDVLGSAQLPAVRNQPQPRAFGDAERRGEVGSRPAALVVGESEADDAAVGVLRGQTREGAGVQGVAGAVGGDHHGHGEPRRGRGVAHRVQHQVGEGGDPPEPCAVATRVDLDLQPPAAVADVVLRGLPHQPSHVVLGAQHRPGHVVEPLEAEPALLVGG